MIKPQTLKGFRDFLPAQSRKRQYVISKLKQAFERFGFEPLETPVLEYEEVLTGKYGQEGEKLMYRFEDHGKRRVAMRYDQTVPLARVIAQYQNEIAFPFKRYQIQPVWRAENTQKGRYREFYQCDCDSVGIDSALADAEIIATAIAAYKALGFKTIKVLLNDRAVFTGLANGTIAVLDKLQKIGKEGVSQELVGRKLVGTREEARILLQSILDTEMTERLVAVLQLLQQFGIDESAIQFSPTLARGLDYYTGIIFEIEVAEYPAGSLSGGGRYDNLIGIFADRQFPAVGFALGFDRTIEAMDALNLFPADLALSSTQVLVTIFSEELKQKSLDLCSRLRSNTINAEIYLGEIKNNKPLERQLKYADQKGIPYVIILGPEEVEKNMLTVKNLQTRRQKQLSLPEFIQEVTTDSVATQM